MAFKTYGISQPDGRFFKKNIIVVMRLVWGMIGFCHISEPKLQRMICFLGKRQFLPNFGRFSRKRIMRRGFGLEM